MRMSNPSAMALILFLTLSPSVKGFLGVSIAVGSSSIIGVCAIGETMPELSFVSSLTSVGLSMLSFPLLSGIPP